MRRTEFDSRWTTLLNVDVVGYSALMARDPVGAVHALLQNVRWLNEAVQRHGGEVIDAPGDNVLAELPTETSALRCGLEIQQHVRERNHGLPPALQMTLRVAVHSGLCLSRNGRRWGHALNVSARLQALAVPGGVIVSQASALRAESQVVERQDYREHVYSLRNVPELVSALQMTVSA